MHELFISDFVLDLWIFSTWFSFPEEIFKSICVFRDEHGSNCIHNWNTYGTSNLPEVTKEWKTNVLVIFLRSGIVQAVCRGNWNSSINDFMIRSEDTPWLVSRFCSNNMARGL
jgi:hypothetical protein